MPVDRTAIDQQLREIGEGERWWEEREFRALPHVLFPDERIRGLVRGKVRDRVRLGVTPAARWLVIATDKRIVCLKQDRVARRQIEIGADQITRFRQHFRLRSVDLVIETSTGRLRIRVGKDDAHGFATAVSQMVPSRSTLALPPDLEPLAWIPGIATVASLPGVAGIVSRVSMLSPAAPPPPGRIERLESIVAEMEAEIDRLKQQVAFLEELLEKRTGESFLKG